LKIVLGGLVLGLVQEALGDADVLLPKTHRIGYVVAVLRIFLCLVGDAERAMIMVL
jgi:hypothetical protein